MAAPRTQDRRRFRIRAAAGAAAIAFLGGVAARGALVDRAGSRPQTSTVPAPPAAQVTGPGPAGDVDGAPAGFTRTRAGAQAAAIAYTATLSQRLLYLEPAAAEAAVRAAAAGASEASLTADALDGLQAAREPLAQGTGATWWIVQPLAAKVEAFDTGRARVSVWLVRVLSRQGVVVPQSSWVTETVELVWEDGDWRLWSDTSIPGPTPVLDGSDLPASAAELDADLVGFELLDPALDAR
jgi:hypothetical protein